MNADARSSSLGSPRFALADDVGAAWLARFPSGSADLVVVSPTTPARRLPAAEGAAQAREQPGALAWEVGRVLARGRRALWLCESRHGLPLARLLERYGLDVAPPIIWDRGDGARGGRLRWIIAASRGKVRGLPALPELITSPSPRGALPDAVAERLVMTGSAAGQWVLEPFAEVPTLALAATRLDRSYWGATRDTESRREMAVALRAAGAVEMAEGPVELRPTGLDVGVRATSGRQTELDIGLAVERLTES